MFGLTRSLVRIADAARDKKEWAVAEGAYKAALKRRPGMARIWVQLGHSLKELGSLAEALAAYRQADLIQPDRADTFHQIARMLHLLGDDEAALTNYEKALALGQSLGGAAHEARWLRARLSARHNPLQTGLPERLRYVALGTTGTCNASCVHCPTGKTETAHVPRVPMSMALFHKIIDGIADLALPITDQVSFGLFGDGLVDPFVVERAAFLMSRRLTRGSR